MKINQIEQMFNSTCHCFMMNVNKFWLQYFGVMNLFTYKCNFSELNC